MEGIFSAVTHDPFSDQSRGQQGQQQGQLLSNSAAYSLGGQQGDAQRQLGQPRQPGGGHIDFSNMYDPNAAYSDGQRMVVLNQPQGGQPGQQQQFAPRQVPGMQHHQQGMQQGHGQQSPAFLIQQQQVLGQGGGIPHVQIPTMSGGHPMQHNPHPGNLPMVVVPTSSSTSFYPEHPRYSGGFMFKVFNDERTHFIQLPSQYVLVTEGSTRYLNCGNAEQMAPRFVLCRHILRDRLCPRGSTCNFIHGVLRAAEGDPAYRRVEVHKNDAMETGVTRYEVLPPGINMMIAYPGEDRSIPIPSQNIYKTRGSELYFRVLPNGLPPKIPQRCTHYHFKKMCHRGAECNFIHIAYDAGIVPLLNDPNMQRHQQMGNPYGQMQHGMGGQGASLMGQQQMFTHQSHPGQTPPQAQIIQQQGGQQISGIQGNPLAQQVPSTLSFPMPK